MDTELKEAESQTFVETALKLGGKSAEEARKTGALDRADEQVEALFALKYQTSGSPAHLAVWGDELPGDLFVARERPIDEATRQVMQRSLDVVRDRRSKGCLLDEQKKIWK